jgi:hypothetical protein
MRKILPAVLMFLSLVGTAPLHAYSQVTRNISETQTDTQDRLAEVVELGIYPLSINALDMERNSYFVDFYLWIKWKGDINPLDNLRFVNMVDEWSTIKTSPTVNHLTLDDGTKYQIMRVEGRFVQPFDFRSFPFDEQKLEIIIEDEEHSARQLLYIIDKDNSSVDRQLRIPGWELRSMKSTIAIRQYDSNFGIDKLDTMYSSASFSVIIVRPASVFYWKLMTPLSIVLLASLSSLLLPARQIDARISLVASGLLAAVFLQRLYLDGLPDISYLVVMDKVYITAYAVIVICLLRVLFTFLKTRHDEAEITSRYRMSDVVVMVALLGFFVLITAGLVLTA